TVSSPHSYPTPSPVSLCLSVCLSSVFLSLSLSFLPLPWNGTRYNNVLLYVGFVVQKIIHLNIAFSSSGVGVGMLMCSAIVCIYYNVIIAWTVYYLVMSFRAVLPWSHCNNGWNSEFCIDDSNRNLEPNVTANITGNMSDIATTVASAVSAAVNITKNKTIPASEEFWVRHVLELSDGIESPGVLRWQLLLCLIFSWCCVFLCLFKGVKVLGKVMHFAAPFPYLVLMVLLVRGCTLPGAIEGIKFYIVPRWEKLADFNVWGDAALQIFYSVGMAWGGIITMASYNKFNNNVYRDAMLVPFINCGTSLFAGFVIFSVLGFMAHEGKTTVEEIVAKGPGLVFVAYPEAIAKLPVSPLWAVLFFLMFFTIGLDSQFGMFETILSGIIDEYPHYLRNKKTIITAIACFVEFLLGMPCITQGGIYVLQIMDWYCASFSLMLISMTECLALSWCYGVDRLYKDIALMIGYEPHFWWKYMWKYVTPLIILFIWIFSVATLGPVTYGDEYQYPEWSIAVGWMMGIISVLPIPIVAVIQIMSTPGSLMARLRHLTKPDKSWGPSQPEDRKRYLADCGRAETELEQVTVSEKMVPPRGNGVYDETTVAFLPQKS
ncbi:sodium- and chloride-dependent glycine transporter 2, partial [Aplysia californica]|uniref:Sodium- and chloride-dependent glycine transporter 2 n=1 Tax=Aplysia californica TaxID=6500 RepID=A0ABM1A5Y1_APLCA